MTVLFDLAHGIANGTVNYTGIGEVPVMLELHVRKLLDNDDDPAARIAHLILLAMAAQRAVDLRLRRSDDNDSDDYDDCSYG
jgi:hypothetical protein